LIDVRGAAAPGQIVEVAEAEAVGIEREEGEAEAGLLVRSRLVEHAQVRAGVVERGVQVAALRGQLTEIEAGDERGLGRQALDEARELLVHDEVRDVLAAGEAR